MAQEYSTDNGTNVQKASLPTLLPTSSKQETRPHITPFDVSNPPSHAVDAFPEGGSRAWLVVSGSFFIICGTFGLVSIVGIFSAYWQEHQLSQYSARDVGWIPAVNVFLILFLGVQIGPMFDRYGPRWLLIVGSVLNVGGLFILAECTAYWHFMLVYGIVIGTAGALLTTTALAVVAHWFERKRGLASGAVFVGSSVGGIVFPLVLRWSFEHLGWKWGIRILAFMVLVMMGIGNLTIKGRLAPKRASGAVGLKCFLDARFSWAVLGIALFEFVLFGALGLLPVFSVYQGFSVQTSYNVVAILSAGSALGRPVSGLVSDRIGRFNTMILTLLWSIIVVFGLWVPVGNRVAIFYTFAPLFGFGSGSIVSMAPVCVGQLCNADQYGQYYGTSYFVVAFTTLLCIPIGGDLLPKIGAEWFVAFFGFFLVLSMITFIIARWACLDYKWKWTAKI